MDQIIETLEQAEYWLEQFMAPKLRSYDGPDLKCVIEKLVNLINEFKDAKKEIEEMFQSYHTEGEPEPHLVQDPAGSETLADSSATKEDDLKELSLAEKQLMWDACVDDVCKFLDSLPPAEIPHEQYELEGMKELHPEFTEEQAKAALVELKEYDRRKFDEFKNQALAKKELVRSIEQLESFYRQ